MRTALWWCCCAAWLAAARALRFRCTDSRDAVAAQPSRLRAIALAPDDGGGGGVDAARRVRVVVAATLGVVSTDATDLAITTAVCTTDGKRAATQHALFLADASPADAERLLRALLFTPLQPTRCADRAFTEPRVDVWLLDADGTAAPLSCADVPPLPSSPTDAYRHHSKRVAVAAAPPSLVLPTTELRVRRGEPTLVSGLTLHVPDESALCRQATQRRFRLRVATARDGGGAVALPPPIATFLAPFLSPLPSANGFDVNATSEYVNVALRSLAYTPPARPVDDAIAFELQAEGDDELLLYRLRVVVVEPAPAADAAAALVRWDGTALHEDGDALVVTLDEDSPLSLARLSLALPPTDGGDVATTPRDVTLTASHGRFVAAAASPVALGTAATQLTGSLAQLNAALSRLRYEPNRNYNGPDAIVVSISTTSAMLRVFLNAVHDTVDLAWADDGDGGSATANERTLVVAPATTLALPPLRIHDGDDDQSLGASASSPFFQTRAFLRADVECAAADARVVDLQHDAVATRENGGDAATARLTFQGRAGSLAELLAGVRVVVSADATDGTAIPIHVRITKVDAANGSTVALPVAEATLRLAIQGRAARRFLSQRSVDVDEDARADLGHIFRWDAFTLPVAGVELRLAVAKGAIASNASAALAGARSVLLVRTASVAQLKTVLSQLTYVPPQDFAGDDALTVAMDGGDATATAMATLRIRVRPENDAPSLAVVACADATAAEAAARGLLSLRQFAPCLRVGDVDAGDVLTVEIALDGVGAASFALSLADARLAALHPRLWIDSTASLLHVRGSASEINAAFASSLVEVVPLTASRSPTAAQTLTAAATAASLRLCVSDAALATHCVASRRVHFDALDALVRLRPPPPRRPPQTAVALSDVVAVDASLLARDTLVALRFSVTSGFIETRAEPACGISTERMQRRADDGSLRVERELRGPWGCMQQLLERSAFRGPSAALATAQTVVVSVELWHAQRRRLSRTFTVTLQPPAPRFRLAARTLALATNTSAPVWRWTAGDAAPLAAFLAVSITPSAADAETATAADAADATEPTRRRLLALTASCAPSCLLGFDADGPLVPHVVYSFAATAPSRSLRFVGTSDSLTRVLAMLQISADPPQQREGDGELSLSLVDVEEDTAAVDTARVAFRFALGPAAPPLQWVVRQRAYVCETAGAACAVDGVALATKDAPPPPPQQQHRVVRLLVECESRVDVRISIDHAAPRVVDRACGLRADEAAIEWTAPLAAATTALASMRVAIAQRDAQNDEDAEDDTAVVQLRLSAYDTAGGEQDAGETEIRVQFVASARPLPLAVAINRSAALAVDDGASLVLGGVLTVADTRDHERLFRLRAAVAHGTLEMPADGRVCCVHLVAPPRGAAAWLLVEGALVALRDALAATEYRPRAAFAGRDALVLTLDEPRSLSPSAAWTSEAPIDVRAVNDAPRIVVRRVADAAPRLPRLGRLQTRLAVEILDADAAHVAATNRSSVVRVRLTASRGATVVLPEWPHPQAATVERALPPTTLHAQTDGDGDGDGDGVTSLTMEAPLAAANAVLRQLLLVASSADACGAAATDAESAAEPASLEIVVSDLGHGVDGWKEATATQRVGLCDSGGQQGDATENAPLALELPRGHAQLDADQRTLTVSGLTIGRGGDGDDDGDGDVAAVCVKGSAAFRVVPEVQRVRLVGPARTQRLTVTLAAADAAAVAGTFDLEATMAAAAVPLYTAVVHAQAVAMRVDEVSGDEGTGRGRGESMEAALDAIYGTAAKVHVVKTQTRGAVVWTIETALAAGDSALPALTIGATAFTPAGAASVAATSETVGAAAIGGQFTLRFGHQQTRAIRADASALELQDALEALASVRAVDVARAGAFAWDVTFFAPNVNIPLLVGDGSSLTPWRVDSSETAQVETARVTCGVGQGAVFEIEVGATPVSRVYRVDAARTASTPAALGGGWFSLGFQAVAAGVALLATTDPIALDAVATARDERVLTQEGGRAGHSMQSALQRAVDRLGDTFAATRVDVARLVTAATAGAAPSYAWLVTFVGAPAAFPALALAASGTGQSPGGVSAAVSLVTPSNAVAGSFALSFEGQQTPPIPVAASASAVQSQLNALPTVRDAAAAFGGVSVRRREIAAVGGAAFAVLFTEQLAVNAVNATASLLLVADGATLTGMGAFARVRGSAAAATARGGAWRVPAFDAATQQQSHTVVWARGVRGSFSGDRFALRGAAADVDAVLRQLTYALPPRWCCGFVRVVLRVEATENESRDAAVVARTTDEKLLPWKPPPPTSVSIGLARGGAQRADGLVAVERGRRQRLDGLFVDAPPWTRGSLWLRLRVEVTVGSLSRWRVPPDEAIDDANARPVLWLNGTLDEVNAALARLAYAAPLASRDTVAVLTAAAALVGPEAEEAAEEAEEDATAPPPLAASEFLLLLTPPPLDPRVTFAGDALLVVARDDAPTPLAGVSVVDANAHAFSSSSGTTSVELSVETRLGRVFVQYTDGLAPPVRAADQQRLTLRGDLPALNTALQSLQYEPSRAVAHARDAVTVRVRCQPSERPPLRDALTLRVEIRHAVHVPRVAVADSHAVALAAKEDNGYTLPNLTLVVDTPPANPRSPRRTSPRPLAYELRRTDLSPPWTTTLRGGNASADDDWRHRLVAEFAGGGSSAVASFAGTSTRFFFAAADAAHGEELWTSDGSAAGTTLLADLLPGPASSRPSDLAVLPASGLLVFAADGIDASWTLGTQARACNAQRLSSVAADFMYVVAQTATWDPAATYDCPRRGWRWATTADATARFPSGSTTTSRGGRAANLSEPFVFWGACDWTGYTFGGVTRKHFRFADSRVTGALKHAGRRDSAPVDVSFAAADFAGIVCVRDDATHEDAGPAGHELWVSDGLSATTAARLRDIEPGPRGSRPRFLTPFTPAWLVFQATTADLGAELYKTDGSSGGTVLVEDIWPGPRGSEPRGFVEWPAASGGDGRLYFAATSDSGRELWSTDGLSSVTSERGRRATSAAARLVGTALVRDVYAGAASSAPRFLTPLGALGVFFAASDGVHGRELWVTDGSAAGTRLVADLNAAPGEGSDPSHLVAFGDSLFFAATSDAVARGRELFTSDGSAAGTRLLLELAPGVASAAPSLLTVVGGGGGGSAAQKLFFHATDADGVASLWASNGTAAGTARVWGAAFAQSHALATRVDCTLFFFPVHDAIYYVTQRQPASRRGRSEDEEEEEDTVGDQFRLEVSVDRGTLALAAAPSSPSRSLTVDGTRGRLESVLRRLLFQPPLHWHALRAPRRDGVVVQWRFAVSALPSLASQPANSPQVTTVDVVVRPQRGAPVLTVPLAVNDAAASARDFLSRLRLACRPLAVREDEPTPLRGFAVRAVDDVHDNVHDNVHDASGGEWEWELDASVAHGRLDVADAAGCVRRVVAGRLRATPRVTLRASRVACLSRVLGSLVYTGDPNFSGADALQLRVSAVASGASSSYDAAATDRAVVPILVAEVNDAPFLTSASGFYYEAVEDAALVIRDLAVVDPDAANSVAVELRVRRGAMSLLRPLPRGSSVVVVRNESAPWAPAASTRLALLGSVADLNVALAGVVYTPARDWHSLLQDAGGDDGDGEGYDVVAVTLSDARPDNASSRAALHVFVAPTPDAVAISPPTVCATSVYAALALADGGALHGDEDAWLETQQLRFASADDSPRATLDVALRVGRGALAMDARALGGVTTHGSAADGSAWRLRGRFALVNRAVATLRYLPARDAYGADALEISAAVEDAYSLPSGPSLPTTRVVVPIKIHAVNDAPQWALPAGATARWARDASTPIAGVALRDVDVAAADCTAACVFDVVVETTGGGVASLALPRLAALVATQQLTVAAAASSTYVALSGSLAALNRALGELVLTAADAAREPVEIWFSADDRGTFGAGGPQVARARLVVLPLARTRHALRVLTPRGDDEVLTLDEDATLVFGSSAGRAVRLEDRDAADGAASLLYEVSVTATHGVFRLAAAADVSRVLVLPTASGRETRVRGFLPQLNAALDGSAYVPDTDWFGADEIRVAARPVDADADAATASVFVVVAPVCDAPRWRRHASRSDDDELEPDLVLDEDGQALLSTLWIVDPDAVDGGDDGRELALSLAVRDGGGVMLATTRGLDVSDAQPPPWATATSLRLVFFSRVTVTGRAAALNAALRGLVYRPAPDFHTRGHVRDAVVLIVAAAGSRSCPQASDADGSSSVTVRARIAAVADAPVVRSPRFRRVAKRNVAAHDPLLWAEPTLEAVAGQPQPLDAVVLFDADADADAVDDAVDDQPPLVAAAARLRVSCRACAVHTSLSLETLQQAHGVAVVASSTASPFSSSSSAGSSSISFVGSVASLNAAVLASLVLTASANSGGRAAVVLEISDVADTPLRSAAYAMAVRVLRADAIGPQILVPPFGTGAPPLRVDEHAAVLLQGAPDVPAVDFHVDEPRGLRTWQLVAVDIHAADSATRQRSLLDVRAADPSALSSFASLSPTQQFVFSAFDPATGSELWTSDGTASGTRLLADISPGPRGSTPQFLTPFSVDTRVYFSASGPNADAWRIRAAHRDACGGIRASAFAPDVAFVVADATTWDPEERYDCPVGFRAMTTHEAAAVFVGTVADAEPLVYYGQCGWRAYDWGGQRRSHFRFADSAVTGAFKHAGRRDSFRPDVGFQTSEFAGMVCRRLREDGGDDEQWGRELWATDGSAGGTVRVTAIGSPSVAARPAFLAEFQGRLFFQASTAAFGAELWATDGSRGGTQLIADVAFGPRGSAPEQLTALGSGKLFFTAETDAYGRELWVSDGRARQDYAQVDHGDAAAVATRLVLDICAGAASSMPQFLVALPASGLVLFQADDGVHGAELWRSDGSAAGTALVRDIRAGPRASAPQFLTAFSGRVFFQADDGASGAELWVSDGSAASTTLLVDLAVGARGAAPRLLSVLALDGASPRLCFAASTDPRDAKVVEFWVSDGSRDGTRPLFDGSREPATLSDAALRALPLGGGFVYFGERPPQAPASGGEPHRRVVSRSLTLVDDRADVGRAYTVTLQCEFGELALPHRASCGWTPALTTAPSVVTLSGSLAQLNCAVAEVVYHATQTRAGRDGWDDAITVTLRDDDSGNTSGDDDGRAFAATQRVAVRVDAINHAPVVTMPARIFAAVDTWVRLPRIGVSDEDAGPAARLLLRVAVQRGRVRLVEGDSDNDNDSDRGDDDADADTVVVLTASSADPRGRPTLELAASAAALSAALRRRVEYACLAADGCTGDGDVLTVLVDDNGFSGGGGPQTATQSAAVVVVVAAMA